MFGPPSMMDLLMDEDLWCLKTMMMAASVLDDRERSIRQRRERHQRIKKRRDELHLSKMTDEKRKILQNRRLSRQLRDMQNPFLMHEKSFRENYIFSPYLAQFLIEELRSLMPVAKQKFAIPLEKKVLLALQYFGNGTNQRSFQKSGFSQRSCSRAIAEVVDALNDPSIMKKWIRFPETRNERHDKTILHLQELGIPGVLGFVGSTHVAITPPAKNEGQKEYCCPRNFHALSVQIVCDASSRIMDISSNNPGSYPSSYVWHISDVRKIVSQSYPSGEAWILGSTSYPMEPWLLTPIVLTETYPPGEKYNMILAKSRSGFLRCIRNMRHLFKCIHQKRSLEYTPEKSSRIVNACAVLYNIFRDANEVESNASDEEDEEDMSPAPEGDYVLRQEAMQNIERITRNFH